MNSELNNDTKSVQVLVDALVFGDLHLEEIRNWRDRELSALGLTLIYPLWHVPYNDLLRDLEESGVTCVVTACHGSYTYLVQESDHNEMNVNETSSDDLKNQMIGMKFTRVLMEQISSIGWDAFGENGEFHTEAQVWTSPDPLGVRKQIHFEEYARDDCL
jgi:diphthamide synthase (EF-2-diphthine--ammonia ligase)